MIAILGQGWSYLKARLNLDDAEGQTIVEYVLMIVLVGLAVFLASPSVTQAILKVFEDTSSALASRPGT